MTTIKSKTAYLVQDIKEHFPKAIKLYAQAGYKDFDSDCAILVDWFESVGGDVPSKATDEIWHGMILYTQKYFSWCEKHFGRVIHHHPKDEVSCDDSCSSHGNCVGCYT